MKRAEIVLEGIVQGVGLRYTVRYDAGICGLKGYVMNLSDGTVKIVCEGRKDSIERFVTMLENLKDPILVQNIQKIHSEKKDEFKTFEIRHEGMDAQATQNMSLEQKNFKLSQTILAEMVEGFGTGATYLKKLDSKQDQMLDKQDQMLDKQDQMLDKQDQMLDKQDQMLDKQDQMLDKQDQMLDKQDQTISEIHNLSSNVSDMLDSRFQKLESEIFKIKQKLEI